MRSEATTSTRKEVAIYGFRAVLAIFELPMAPNSRTRPCHNDNKTTPENDDTRILAYNNTLQLGCGDLSHVETSLRKVLTVG